MKKILLILFCAFCLLGVYARGNRGAEAEMDRRKADYIFMQASIDQIEEKQNTDVYMLLRRAARLNPSDAYIAASLAEMELATAGGDSSAVEDIYNTIRRRFMLEPTNDVYAGKMHFMATLLRRYDDLISMCEMLDTLMPSRTDPAIHLAEALVNKGKAYRDTPSIRRAIDVYGRLQETLPGNPQLVRLKIQAQRLLGDSASVRDELRRLSAEAPRDVNAMLFISAMFTGLDENDSAMAYLDRATALEPDNGTVRLMRAGIYNYRGDSVGYRREVRLAIESPDLEYEQKFSMLREYVTQVYNDSVTNPADIEALFTTLQEINPGESSLHELFGDYYSETGNHAGAVEQYEFALDLDHSDMELYDAIIREYGMLQDSVKVVDFARQSLARFPGDLYAAIMGASGLSQMDLPREGIAMLDSIEIEPNHNPKALATVFAFKGDLYSGLNEPDSALAAYDKAINYDADNYLALNNAAYLMAQEERDLPRAEVYASIAVAANSGSATYIDTYAWVLFKKRDYARALEYIDRALAVCTPEAAQESSTEIPEPQEPSADILDHAGDIYYMNGRPDEAVEFWRRALEITPDDELIRKKYENKAYYFK